MGEDEIERVGGPLLLMAGRIPDGTVTPEVIVTVTATVTLPGAIAAGGAIATLTATPALALACRGHGGLPARRLALSTHANSILAIMNQSRFR